MRAINRRLVLSTQGVNSQQVLEALKRSEDLPASKVITLVPGEIFSRKQGCDWTGI